MPRLSIVMPTYNKSHYVVESINSILTQDYTDLELFVIDDGSPDNTLEVLSKIKDPRVRILQRQHRGIVACLNEGLNLASGDLIQVMDHDDLCAPGRYRKQVEFLDTHHDIDAVGSWVKTFGRYEADFNYGIKHDDIKASLLFECGMSTCAMIVRRKAFEKAGYYYDNDYLYAEDMDFLYRFINSGGRVENIPEHLFLYRVHEGQASTVYHEAQQKAADSVLKQWLQKLELFPTEDEFKIHKWIGKSSKEVTRENIEQSLLWINKLLSANEKHQSFHPLALRKFIEERWRIICTRGTKQGIWILPKYFLSGLTKVQKMRPQDQLRLIMNAILKR